MAYQLFRLSLISRTRPPLIEYIEEMSRAEVPHRQDRPEFLKDVFGGRIDFNHHGNTFAYVKIGEIGSVIVGRLGRQIRERSSEPPEKGYAPLEREGYRAVNIFIDTASDRSGQKVAIKIDQRLGTARRILERLIEKANDQYPDAAWMIEMRPIISEDSFWMVVERRRHDITDIKFDLVVPNVLGLGATLSEELKKARDDNNASEAGVEIKNPHGIAVETDSIRDAVHYVSEGGGNVILKGGKKTLFNSKNKVAKVDVAEDQDISPDNRSVWRRLINALFSK